MSRFAEAFIGLVLRLYPRRFRRRHGSELRRLYLDRLQSRPSPVRILLEAALDTLHDAPGAHLDELRRRRAARNDLEVARPDRRERILPTAPEIRQTLRSLRRRPGFSLVVVAVLALGIGANTAIFSLVRGVLLAPLPFPEPENLVRVWGTNQGRLNVGGTLSYPDIVDMAERSRTLAGVAAYDEWTTNLTGDGDPQRIDGALVSASFFDVLGVAPAVGRHFVPEDDIDGQDRVVVLEHGFWQSRFGGDRSVVGRKIILNGNPHEIVGVAPADFEDPQLSGSDPRPRLWRPLGLVGAPEEQLPARGGRSYVAVARLATGVRMEAAQAEIATITAQLEREYPDIDHERGAVLVSLQDQLVGDVDESLLLLLGAVGFLLAIAVANVSSMMLGRVAERAGESDLRRALGAGQLALVRHGMLESMVLGLVGGTAGIGLAHLLVRLFVGLAGSSLPRADRVRVDAEVLAFAVALSVGVGLACGLLPALRSGLLRQPRWSEGGSRTAGGATVLRLRGVLVTAQIGMALVLLHGATLLGGSLLNLQRIDVGVEREGLVTFDLSLPGARYPETEQRNAYFAEVLHQLAELPAVERVSSTNILPLSGNFDGNPVLVPIKPSPDPDGAWSVQTRSVSEDFFATSGVPILRGRPIEASDRHGRPPVAVVNQAFVDFFWPGGEALGERIVMGDDQEIEVIGVAGDTKHMGLVEEPIRHVYLARDQGVIFWQNYRQTILLKVAQADARLLAAGSPSGRTLAEDIRQAVWQVDPDIPVANLRTMDQLVDQTVRRPRLRATLIMAFAALALVLGAVGIYGVSSYGIALERRALAVRMALGADGGDIARHVLGRVTAWAATGSLFGLAGAWLLGRVIERFLYGTGSRPQELLALVALLVAVALASGWLPARRAACIDPVSNLKAD